MTTHTNRLIHASSPYLLQHAHNPVDWFEWSYEAFEKAKREDKLVLVSIGYSACHWCHVMEHECFEKEDTAALMNEHFVCIKVDREERPDIDQIYMDAVQLLTGRGGWPLNCFTLPDGRPLHGGTYFPKKEWEQTLQSLANFYKNNKEEALRYATDLTNGVKKLDVFSSSQSELMSEKKLDEIIKNWSVNFDNAYGGFNWSPKFPMPNNWQLFLHYAHQKNDKQILNAVHLTLQKMAEGGIFDQIDGGFARYSTDSFWKVPHFEKMLYDNAQLMSLYSMAFQQSGNELYKKTVEKIHRFIQSELTSKEGLFFSALDADSEGEEGKFYVWTRDELQKLLGKDEPIFSLYYSVDAYGNWEHGNNILYKTRNDDELQRLTGKPISEINLLIEKCNNILLAHRNKRVKPSLDDKVILSWNALMIKGYADAYKAFHDKTYLDTATKAADFILEKMFVNERLHRIYKNGKISIPAFAEDYALIIEALIHLYLVNGNDKYALNANEYLQQADKLFFDANTNLYRFKALTDAQLIANKTDINDDVIPAANSVMAKNLFLLSFLFSNETYLEKSKLMLQRVQEKIENFPSGFSNWMQLLLWHQYGLNQVVCTGEDAEKFATEIEKHFSPNTIVMRKTQQSQIPLLAEKDENVTQIYLCHNQTCGLPTTDIEQIKKQLS